MSKEIKYSSREQLERALAAQKGTDDLAKLIADHAIVNIDGKEFPIHQAIEILQIRPPSRKPFISDIFRRIFEPKKK